MRPSLSYLYRMQALISFYCSVYSAYQMVEDKNIISLLVKEIRAVTENPEMCLFIYVYIYFFHFKKVKNTSIHILTDAEIRKPYSVLQKCSISSSFDSNIIYDKNET